MKLKPTLISFALAVGVANSMAANYVIGSLPIAPAIYSNAPSVAPGGFTDLYSFLFPAGVSTASGSAITIDVAALLNIDSLQVSLLNSSFSTLASGGVGESSTLFDQALMAGGSYYFQVTGNASGSVGGAYAFLASAAPIPEPGTLALLLAGVCVVGTVVRRRSAQA